MEWMIYVPVTQQDKDNAEASNESILEYMSHQWQRKQLRVNFDLIHWGMCHGKNVDKNQMNQRLNNTRQVVQPILPSDVNEGRTHRMLK